MTKRMEHFRALCTKYWIALKPDGPWETSAEEDAAEILNGDEVLERWASVTMHDPETYYVNTFATREQATELLGRVRHRRHLQRVADRTLRSGRGRGAVGEAVPASLPDPHLRRRGGGMSLKEAALEAAKESQDEYRLRALQDRETKLTALIEKWDEKWEWKYNLGTPPVPDRSEFTFGKVRGDSYRAETLHGFRFEIEEIPFIYSTTYGDEGLHLILTCPECQQEHATHFHSLSALGELLKKNRSISHRCLENEIKDVAYAIRSTARALKLPDAHVAELALQKAYELS